MAAGLCACLALVPVTQVSVGRLGILLELTFKIVPNRPVQRNRKVRLAIVLNPEERCLILIA